MFEFTSPYVHYYNRGVNKETIFYDHAHYEYLIQTIYRFLPKYQIELIAYCLMPNHYHILLKHDNYLEGSRFIQRVFNAFTQGINKQIDRVGTLFQGSVKKRIIEDDDYLATTIQYIHLHPVKSRLCLHPEAWRYSDFLEWIEVKKSIRNVVFERERIFGNIEDYLELINLEVASFV